MVSLKEHNTFGIEAGCKRFVEYTTADKLASVLREMRGEEPTPVFHIGAGSNLVFTADYPGTILHSAIKTCEIVEETPDGHVLLRVGSGYVWDELVQWTLSNGLYGLENLSLIPGEVGASAVQNVGAYGKEAGQFIVRVEALAAADGSLRTFTHDECHYAYRSSVFKHALRGQYYITHVTYRLSQHFTPDLSYRALSGEVARRALDLAQLSASDVRNLVCELRRSKLPEPCEVGSAGSFFMNPVVPAEKAQALAKAYPDMPHFDAEGGVKIPAAWLIEQAGWKGKRLGQAGVWPKQALVLVNYGGATGQDILSLSQQIQADVRAQFGIALYPEAIFVP